MAPKIQTMLQSYFKDSSDRTTLIFDDSKYEVRVTFDQLKTCVDKLTDRLGVEPGSPIVAVAFDVNASDVLNVVPSILAALLIKVWTRFVLE